MHDFCVRIAGYLADRTGQPDRTAVLAYGLELLLGELSKLAVLFVLAALLGIFPATFLVTVSTMSFRLLSGGKHCSSHLRCLITTLTIYLSLGWLIGFIRPWFSGPWLPWIFTVSFLSLIAAIYFWVPLGNEHRKLDTPEEKKKFRRLSFILVTGWFLSGLLPIAFFKDNPLPVLYYTATTTGLLFQGITVSPLGIKITEGLNAFTKGD